MLIQTYRDYKLELASKETQRLLLLVTQSHYSINFMLYNTVCKKASISISFLNKNKQVRYYVVLFV